MAWMDGRDGWMDGMDEMGGWVDGWMGGCMHACMHRQMDGLMARLARSTDSPDMSRSQTKQIQRGVHSKSMPMRR